MTTGVRMVVFDLGGVLVRICRSWPEACARVGLDVRAGWDDPGRRRERERLSAGYHMGLYSTEEFCNQLSGGANGLYTPREVRSVHDAWLIEEYVGVSALIDDLHGAGIVTGVLSNTNEAHWERLAGTPERAPEFAAPSKVRHLHASHLLRTAKPAIECYRMFESICGAGISGEAILFFDDLAENISGAMDAGWRGHLIDHTGDTAAQMRAALESAGVWRRNS